MSINKNIPVTNREKYLAKIAGAEVSVPVPVNKRDKILANIAGEEVAVSDPVNREDYFLNEIAKNGSGGGAVSESNYMRIHVTNNYGFTVYFPFTISFIDENNTIYTSERNVRNGSTDTLLYPCMQQSSTGPRNYFFFIRTGTSNNKIPTVTSNSPNVTILDRGAVSPSGLTVSTFKILQLSVQGDDGYIDEISITIS